LPDAMLGFLLVARGGQRATWGQECTFTASARRRTADRQASEAGFS
jgi:hypothetical protein